MNYSFCYKTSEFKNLFRLRCMKWISYDWSTIFYKDINHNGEENNQLYLLLFGLTTSCTLTYLTFIGNVESEICSLN